jgi:hypothetical protein
MNQHDGRYRKIDKRERVKIVESVMQRLGFTARQARAWLAVNMPGVEWKQR